MNSKFLKISLLAVLTVAFGSCGDDGSNNKTDDNPTTVCTAGTIRCKGKQLQSCINNSWTKKEDCPNGCDEAQNLCKEQSADPETKTCTADELRCEGNVLQVCKDNAWTKKEDCANGCDSDKKVCKDENPTGPDPNVCTADDLRCDGNQLQICKDNAWTKKEDCANGCDSASKTCKTSSTPGTNLICDEGDKKCDGNYIVECKNDKWKKADTPCEKGCKLGVCKTQVSDPSDPSDLIACDDAGCISMSDYSACSATCKGMGQEYCYLSFSEGSYSCSAVKKEATGSLSTLYPANDLVTCEDLGCKFSSDQKVCADICKGAGFNYCYVSISENTFFCSGKQLEATGKLPENPSAYSPEDLGVCDDFGCMDSAENIKCSESCKKQGQNYCYIIIPENTYACSDTQQAATGKPPENPATNYPPEDLVACEDYGCMDSADGIKCSESCKAKGQNYCYVVLSANTYICSSTQQTATGKKPENPATNYPPEDLVDCDDAFCQLSAETSCLDNCKSMGNNYCYIVLSQDGAYTCSAESLPATGVKYSPSDLAECTATNCNNAGKTCLSMCQEAGKNYCYIIISEGAYACSSKQHAATGSI